jgi:calnexin
MTEDILCKQPLSWNGTADASVDNIYVGHDAADAKKFASETYHVKKAIEKELEGSDSDEIEIQPKTLLEKVQLKVYEFIRESLACTAPRRHRL